MKELRIRDNIIAAARKKYIPFQTNNVSKALELYLKNDTKEQIFLTINRKTRLKNIADLIGRPDCPECEQEMMLRIINAPQGKQNLKGWETCWECLNCGHEQYSTKTIQELIKESKNK
jgi:hypothetical protein